MACRHWPNNWKYVKICWNTMRSRRQCKKCEWWTGNWDTQDWEEDRHHWLNVSAAWQHVVAVYSTYYLCDQFTLVNVSLELGRFVSDVKYLNRAAVAQSCWDWTKHWKSLKFTVHSWQRHIDRNRTLAHKKVFKKITTTIKNKEHKGRLILKKTPIFGPVSQQGGGGSDRIPTSLTDFAK